MARRSSKARRVAQIAFFVLGIILLAAILYPSVPSTTGTKKSDFLSWLVTNDFDRPVALYVEGFLTGVWNIGKSETRFASRVTRAWLKENYGVANPTLKGYEFLSGEGEISNLVPGDETVVKGGQGDLVFCKTSTWEPIDSLEWAITVTKNVPPGVRDEVTDPCPSL